MKSMYKFNLKIILKVLTFSVIGTALYCGNSTVFQTQIESIWANKTDSGAGDNGSRIQGSSSLYSAPTVGTSYKHSGIYLGLTKWFPLMKSSIGLGGNLGIGFYNWHHYEKNGDNYNVTQHRMTSFGSVHSSFSFNLIESISPYIKIKFAPNQVIKNYDVYTLFNPSQNSYKITGSSESLFKVVIISEIGIELFRNKRFSLVVGRDFGFGFTEKFSFSNWNAKLSLNKSEY